MDTPRAGSAPPRGESPDRRLPAGAVPALVVLGATALGLVEASQVQYDRAVQGAPITWGHALVHGLPRWYAWAALLPAIVAVTRRLHARGLPWPARFLAHAAAGCAFTLVQVFLFSTVSTALHGEPGLVQHLRPAFLKYVGLTFLGGLVTYAVLVTGWHAWRVYREGRRREREAARLEVRTAELKTLLAEAQLDQLQSQLQPHFLFNALHTLGALIRSGDEAAGVRMTRGLSDLLRRSLQLIGRPEIPLREELELVDSYLEIQRIRFGDRLRTRVDAAEDALDALLPTLVLQPLVENAIGHGIERRAGVGRIEVRAARRGEDLVVVVSDDGPGPARPRADRAGDRRDGGRAGGDPGRGPTDGGAPGIGLRNGRERLRELYGDAASLELAAPAEGGAEARLRVPYHTEPVTPPAPAAGAEPAGARR